MSSILKAIRKIEDEKRSGGNETPDLMVDHGTSSNNRKASSLLLLFSGILLGGVLAGLIVWGVQRSDDDGLNASESSSGHKADSNPAIEMSEKQPPVEHTVSSSIPETAADNQPLTPVSAGDQNNDTETTVADLEPPVNTVNISNVDTAPVPDSDVSSSLPPGVSLHVSEIFYSDQANDSMAVVNELPVMVGTHIDSAVVSAIHADRVDFQISGEVYSVEIVRP